MECEVVTGVDDHSRYCVIAAAVPPATGRAACPASATTCKIERLHQTLRPELLSHHGPGHEEAGLSRALDPTMPARTAVGFVISLSAS